MEHDPDHADAVSLLNEVLLPRCVEAGFHARIQLPIILSANTAPEPDVTVVATTVRALGGKHPDPTKILAVIEVAYTSLDYDRTTKLELYAGANIPVYWIVNLIDRQIEVYDRPNVKAGTYAGQTVFQRGQSAPLRLSGSRTVQVLVDDVLP